MEESVKGKSNFGRAVVFGVVLVCALSSGVFGQPWDGNGVEGDPYQIWTAEDMQAIGANSDYWSTHFKLMADIDLGGYTGTSFNRIGTSTSNPFTGVFDGDGHTISHFTYVASGIEFVGLFGCVRLASAEIRDLGLIEANVQGTSGKRVGPLVGHLFDGMVRNCWAKRGSVSGGDLWTGGLVGLNSDGIIIDCHTNITVSATGTDVGGLTGNNSGTIKNCYAIGDVSGNGYVGGLSGYNFKGRISESFAMGDVSGTSWCLGGLLGLNQEGEVSNCYAMGNISGTGSYNGGLVGFNGDDVSSLITRCYSTGTVTGGSFTGGLVGDTRSGARVTDSFWDTESSGLTISDGGAGKTTAEMQTRSTFTNSGWDFVGEVINGANDIWQICEGEDYPRLAWEKYGGGSGTASDPYLIYDANQMNSIGENPNDWGAHFRLMADIDLADYNGLHGNPAFNIIGNDVNSFTGVFDGGGHTIGNFVYESNGVDYIGLFGYVDGASAEIRDLGLIGPDVNAGTNRYTGSLVGRLQAGDVFDCYVENGRVVGDVDVGGLIGYNYKNDISGCYSTGIVNGRDIIGGLIGTNGNGNITDCYSGCDVSGSRYVGGLGGDNFGELNRCYAAGSVVGTGPYAGGLVGLNINGTVSNSYSSGGVTGDSMVGGLLGQNHNGVVLHCYSTSVVVGNTWRGGLIGYDETGTYSSSFWDIEVNPSLNGLGNGANPEVIGESTANMWTESTFTDAGWDFATPVWTICEDEDYPKLWWEEAVCSDYGGGSGTAEDPYLIYTAAQMNAIGARAYDWGAHFKQMADIDLGGYAGTSFNMIGVFGFNPFVDMPFMGVFDGGGHTILNFTYNYGGDRQKFVGMFGNIDTSMAEVKNVIMINPNVDGGDNGVSVGALVGNVDNGTLRNCKIEGGSVTASWAVGALAGRSVGKIVDCEALTEIFGDWPAGGLVGGIESGGLLEDCYSGGEVHGQGDVGGLAGQNGGEIVRCYSTGTINGHQYVGGLVGENTGSIAKSYSEATVVGTGYEIGGLAGRSIDGAISDSYSNGDVSGNNKIGGLTSVNVNGSIVRCYSSGNVSGVSTVGGLVGWNIDGTVLDSFWDRQTSGLTYSDGGTGLTTAEMQTESTFTDAGWDFTTPVWTIDEGLDYPRLWWESGIILTSIDMDEMWMYQSLAGQSNSDLTASVSVTDDPWGNSSYSYAWEIVLPEDVNLAPVTVDGGGAGDAYWTFAARGCDEPGGLSDSGQVFKVRVTVTGDDYGNTGQAEAEFGIALLGDVNNDGVVNVADRAIANAFWVAGSAGPYTLRDCDVNCDGVVNVADRAIANAIWVGGLGQKTVSNPCLLR